MYKKDVAKNGTKLTQMLNDSLKVLRSESRIAGKRCKEKGKRKIQAIRHSVLLATASQREIASYLPMTNKLIDFSKNKVNFLKSLNKN